MLCAKCGTVYPKAVGFCPVCKTGADTDADTADVAAVGKPGQVPAEGPVPDTPAPGGSRTPRASSTPLASESDPGTRGPTTNTQPWLGAPDVDDVLGGRYRILSILGKGGRGVVYRAEDMELNEHVAIKLLQPMYTQSTEEVARLKLEIVNARKITHPNVVRIHDLQFAKDMPFISMELLTGGTLRDRLKLGALKPRDAFHISIALADGLAAVHKNDIIHRDIKPENILFNEESVPKLVDFGIARLTTNAERTRGVIRGTPQYMSPEQFRGEALTPRSDIYSFGAVMYRMFTDKVPFRAKENVVLARMHQFDPPLKPSDLNDDVPPEIERIILQCLEKDKDKRFGNGRELRKYLRAARDRMGWDRSTDYSTIWSAVDLRASASLVERRSTTTAPVTDDTEVGEDEPSEEGSVSTDVKIIAAPESVSKKVSSGLSTGLALAGLVALFGIGALASWALDRFGNVNPPLPTPAEGRTLALPRTTAELEFEELGYLQARDYAEGTYEWLAYRRTTVASGKRDVVFRSTKSYLALTIAEENARQAAAAAAADGREFEKLEVAGNAPGGRHVEYRLYQKNGEPQRVELTATLLEGVDNPAEARILVVPWPF